MAHQRQSQGVALVVLDGVEGSIAVEVGGTMLGSTSSYALIVLVMLDW